MHVFLQSGAESGLFRKLFNLTQRLFFLHLGYLWILFRPSMHFPLAYYVHPTTLYSYLPYAGDRRQSPPGLARGPRTQ